MQIPEHHSSPSESESPAEEHRNPYFRKAPQVTLMQRDLGSRRLTLREATLRLRGLAAQGFRSYTPLEMAVTSRCRLNLH